jgi:hypothetical protein
MSSTYSVVATAILLTALPGGPPSMSFTSVVAATRITDSTPRGPVIDVFYIFGGGCCQTSADHRCLLHLRWWLLVFGQHPPGALPSTSSSTSVVAIAKNTDGTPQGAHHRHLLHLRSWVLPDFGQNSQGPCHRCLLQLRWWPLPKILTAPPGGHHRRLLQLWWWPLSEIPTAPLKGLTSMSSSSSVVAAVGLRPAPPRGLAIDVLNFGGVHCQKYQQHHQGGPPSMPSTSVVATTGNTDSTP